MLGFHASMPALSPAALRSLELSCQALLAALGAVAAWLFGPGGLLHALAWLGCIPAALLAAEVALRRWARRRALPFVPRRNWREAWRAAARAASGTSVLVRSLLFGLNVAQLGQGRPFWALDPNGWVSVAIGAVFWFCSGLMQRGSAARA
jgi:hypothetical protein